LQEALLLQTVIEYAKFLGHDPWILGERMNLSTLTEPHPTEQSGNDEDFPPDRWREM